MVSERDRCKRQLVSLMLALAVTYHVNLSLSRDSRDYGVLAAFRKLMKKVHPDRGGAVADAQSLTGAHITYLNVFPVILILTLAQHM